MRVQIGLCITENRTMLLQSKNHCNKVNQQYYCTNTIRNIHRLQHVVVNKT